MAKVSNNFFMDQCKLAKVLSVAWQAQIILRKYHFIYLFNCIFFLWFSKTEVLTRFPFPYTKFEKLLIDDELVVGADYKGLRTRVSCYVKMTLLTEETRYARVCHFFYLFREQVIDCYVGLHFFTEATIDSGKNRFKFSFVNLEESPLQYRHVQFIHSKVNLFPVFGADNTTVTGYWVTPTSAPASTQGHF